MSKLRDAIVKSLEDNLTYRTVEQFGIDIKTIIDRFKIEVNADMCEYLLLELFNNKEIPNEYKGFKIEIQGNSGSFAWFNDSGNWMIYATPFWGGNATIPIECYEFVESNDMIDQGYYEILIPEIPQTVDEVKKWYVDFYLPIVYKQIQEAFGVDTINESDDKYKKLEKIITKVLGGGEDRLFEIKTTQPWDFNQVDYKISYRLESVNIWDDDMNGSVQIEVSINIFNALYNESEIIDEWIEYEAVGDIPRHVIRELEDKIEQQVLEIAGEEIYVSVFIYDNI